MKASRFNTIGGWFVGLTAASMLSGCAFGDRHLTLKYDPVMPQQQSNGVKVAVANFTDTRLKPEVGQVRNGFGAVTAVVRADGQGVGEWVSNALADELARAGYEVKRIANPAEADVGLVVTGDVPEANADMFMTYNATVRSNVVVAKTGATVFTKHYMGNARPVAWWGSPEEYQNALKLALQALMKQMVPEVIGQLGRENIAAAPPAIPPTIASPTPAPAPKPQEATPATPKPPAPPKGETLKL